MKRIFISYATEDYDLALRIYNDLKEKGAEPWLDIEDLLPGQNWKIIIKDVIRDSDYFLTLLSSRSVSKKGFVQEEQRVAFEEARTYPPDKIFIIPVRLDDCQSPYKELQDIHYADLSVSPYEDVIINILRAMDIAPGDPTGTHPSEINEFKETISELERWKQVHHDAQDLFNRMNIPLELLIRCRYKATPELLDYAAEKWYGLCVPKLKFVLKKIGADQYPEHDLLDMLQQEMADADEITKKLRMLDANPEDIRSLCFQFGGLKDIVFNILSVADMKIMRLIASMRN